MTSYEPVSKQAPFLWHGGDYNPEQWSREVWQEDFKLMRQAGITVVSVGIFSWVSLQPAEDKFTFEWLDEILDGLHANGIRAILATPSAAQPAWMSAAYPDVLRSDDHGVRHPHGKRVNYCPNSPDYRRLSGEIARALAERYKDHPALLLWHVSNEYGGTCTCETCAANFRTWLKAKYGTLDELNARWWTAFWSHTYTDWSQIMPPLEGGETLTHGLNVDYFRFMSASQLDCFRNERDILRSITPEIPITTNLMGTYKPLDYRQWAKEMDVVSWDCYPRPNQSSGEIALLHDLNRGLERWAALPVDGADAEQPELADDQRAQATGRAAACGAIWRSRTARIRCCISNGGAGAAAARCCTARSSSTTGAATRASSAKSARSARS